MWYFVRDKKSRDFFRFWFAQLISQFGDRVYQMALVGLMAMRHPGSVVEMAKLLAFTIFPVFIIGPIAGVYIDRWDRRTTLFICDFIRGLLVLFAAFYLVHLPDIWPMYAVVFIIFSFSRFYVPAKMSFIPEMVHEDDLHIANSLSTTTGMIALVLGALLGGLIVEYTGSFGGFCWGATGYFLSGLLVFSISSLRRRLPNKKEIITGTKEMIQSQKSVWHEILDGIHYIGSKKEIGFIFWMMAILFAAAGAIYVVIIVFIQQAFHSVTKDLGFLAVPLGFGLFLGSLTYGRWGTKIAAYKVIFWSLILGGIMVVLFASMVASTHNRFLALGLSLVLGYVVGPVVIASNTVVNKVCAMEMSGKVFAALEFVMYLAFLLAMMVSSLLSEHIQSLWILIAVGGIFMVVGFAGLLSVKGMSAFGKKGSGMMNFAVLASGRGSNLQAIIKAVKDGKIKAHLKAVISDKKDAYALEHARQAQIPAVFINPKDFNDRESFDRAVVERLRGFKIDFVVLAGYMRLVSDYFIEQYPDKVLNIHPSLLPQFKGMHAIKKAFDSGVAVTGCSVHFVVKEMDAGPIILQEPVRVDPRDTLESLEEKIHQAEHRVYPQAIDLFVRGKAIGL